MLVALGVQGVAKMDGIRLLVLGLSLLSYLDSLEHQILLGEQGYYHEQIPFHFRHAGTLKSQDTSNEKQFLEQAVHNLMKTATVLLKMQ